MRAQRDAEHRQAEIPEIDRVLSKPYNEVLYLMYEKLHYVGSYTGQYPYQKAQYYNETIFADVLFTPQQNFGIIVCVIISYFHITTI